MKYAIRQQSRGPAAAKQRRPRTLQRDGSGRLVGSLSITYALLVSLIIAPGARAQTGPPQPGLNDPVDNYIFFPSHDLVSFSPEGFLNDWTSDPNLNLSLRNKLSYSWPYDTNQIVAASGHIWQPQTEQVVYARRPNNGSDIYVAFAADQPYSGPSQVLQNLAPRLPNSADFMDIAAGDLDKVPDSAGDNHDEVVVAYASPGANNQMAVQVAVLDYTQPAEAPPSPVAVTTAQASHTINGNEFATAANPTGVLPVDNVLGVAVGDFDGDGLKEIALAHIEDHKNIWITMFRYTNDGAGNRVLKEMSATPRAAGASYSATVDVAAADFDGKGKDELLVGLAEWATGNNFTQAVGHDVWQFDSNLNVTAAHSLGGLGDATQIGFDNTGARKRVQVSPGLFKYDPANGFDLNRRQFVAAWNTPDGNLLLTTYQISDDLTTITQISQSGYAAPSPGGTINHRFSIAAGAYAGNASSPSQLLLWGVTLSILSSLGYPTLATLDSNLSVAYSTEFANANPDDGMRSPVVPVDLDGKSIQLGAPVHFIIDGLVNTDFVLQEPPKHAFYDNRPTISINGQPQPNPTYGQVVTVSRYDQTNVALKTSTQTTFSGKSSDSSDWSIGASVTANAGGSVEAGFGDVDKVSASVDVTAKVGYDYNQNKDNYNSNYSERTLTQTEATDHDDKLLGRLQTFDIWRYRVYGVSVNDQQGNPTNAFYEVVLPGPTLPFNGGGLNFDWYQPTYENGNILSYPLPSTGTFTPSDLGAYNVPCPDEKDAACVPCDLKTDPACADFGNGKTLTKPILEPLVPAAQNFFDGTSGSLSYDYKGATGSGGTFSYSHKLAESLDVKVGVKAKVGVGVFTGKAHASVDAELHNSNSWSGMRTSDSSTTSDTGITLSRSSGDSTQAYAFYPTFYTAQDGTIKVTHAADVLGSSIGRSFWAGLYGRKADPALNLPSRFSPSYGPTGTLTGWTANYLSSRKKLRGFFLRKSTLNPVSNTYDLLSSTPLDGDQVRVEANVYNYSTAVEINNLKVRFDVIGYDSDSDTEIKFTSCPSGATLQPQTGRCTVGETFVAQLDPLQSAPATITWDTTGFGPAQAGQSSEYRVYVVLDPDNTIDETYETEDPQTTYPCNIQIGPNQVQPCSPPLPQGLDPGQNNEGFGLATVTHPSVSSAPVPDILVGAAPSSPAFGADVSLRNDSLVAATERGRIRAVRALARLNRPLRLRVKLYSDTAHDEFSHVLIYDGDPDQGGRMIAAKVVHSGNKDGASAWFEWQPRSLGRHTLHARVVEKFGDAKPDNHTNTLDVYVVRADLTPPRLAVTLTPSTLRPADRQMVPVTAHVAARDDHDQEPEIKLEAITHNEANDAAADVTGAEFGTDDRSFSLRAARDGRFGLRERVYEVTYSATDWAGNKTYTKAYVIVPRRPRN